MKVIHGTFLILMLAAASMAATGLETYRALTRFELTGGAVTAERFRLVRDRVEMTFTGTFYLEAPVAGAVRGAVFVGQGSMKAEPSPVPFERDNVRRLLKAETVESDFQNAVLRFTDETGKELAALPKASAAVTDGARELFGGYAKRTLKESGLNLEARIATSILNGEKPGVFAAQFDKGKLGRFTYVFDPQTRVPSDAFDLNAGEKGLIFAYKGIQVGTEVWMAFPAMEDLKSGRAAYSDQYDLISAKSYTMDVDLRSAGDRTLKIETKIDCAALGAPVRSIPFNINNGLYEYNSIRLKRAMRITSAALNGTTPAEFIQEDWETGLTVILPEAQAAGSTFTLTLKVEGDFLMKSNDEEAFIPGFGEVRGLYYPRINTAWYPHHGYMNSSTFEFTFHHKKGTLVAAAGQRLSEDASGSEVTTRFKIDTPVAFVTFAEGQFDRQVRKSAKAGADIEFYGASGFLGGNKQEYMLTELENGVTYFSQLFGPVPWKRLTGVFHPRPFGQGFPTIILLPPTRHANNKKEFAFIAHEVSHQWWGDLVRWRTYRDQWLSEGFAQYSAALYTAARMDLDAERMLIRTMRWELKSPPETELGIRSGRVVDMGPVVLGHRLATRESTDAYQMLVYQKGALILRMIHFLLSNPATGDDAAFYEMMKDFVRRYSTKPATTEDFRDVAAEYFARSPIARKYGLRDLNWFFRQWVYEANLPRYQVSYKIEGQPDGSAVVRGAVMQANAGENWFMPIPIVFRFGKDQVAKGTINANGARNEFSIKLPAKPTEVLIDPDRWVLSEDDDGRGEAEIRVDRDERR